MFTEIKLFLPRGHDILSKNWICIQFKGRGLHDRILKIFQILKLIFSEILRKSRWIRNSIGMLRKNFNNLGSNIFQFELISLELEEGGGRVTEILFLAPPPPDFVSNKFLKSHLSTNKSSKNLEMFKLRIFM